MPVQIPFSSVIMPAAQLSGFLVFLLTTTQHIISLLIKSFIVTFKVVKDTRSQILVLVTLNAFLIGTS